MNNKGFTLIELLVVVLIIGILAAMAMPQYFKAVERSRMSEAVTLLGNLSQAQQRKYLQINRYTADYRALDVAPKGATGATYYTKGAPTTGANGNGFKIDLSAETGYAAGHVTATRHSSAGNLQYKYNLDRYYASNNVTCNGTDDNGKALCADFCGIDTPTNSCCSDGTSSACAAPAGND